MRVLVFLLVLFSSLVSGFEAEANRRSVGHSENVSTSSGNSIGNGKDGFFVSVPTSDAPAPAAKPPRANNNQWMSLLGAVCFVGYMLFSFVRRITGQNLRVKTPKDMHPFTYRLIIIMGLASKCDGRIDQRELETIAEVASRTSGAPISAKSVQKLINAMPKVKKRGEFAKICKGLDDEEKRLLLRAARMVVEADGTVNSAEKRFLRTLERALKLPDAQASGQAGGSFAPVT